MVELEQKVGQLTQQLEGMSAEREQVKGVADRFQGMEDRMKALLQLSEILSVRYNPFLEHEEPSLYDNRDAQAFLPRGAPPDVAAAARRSALAEVVPVEPDVSEGEAGQGAGQASRQATGETAEAARQEASQDRPGAGLARPSSRPSVTAPEDAEAAPQDAEAAPQDDGAPGNAPGPEAALGVAQQSASRQATADSEPENAAGRREATSASGRLDGESASGAWRIEADADQETASSQLTEPRHDDPALPALASRGDVDLASQTASARRLHRPAPRSQDDQPAQGVPAPPRLAFQALCWFERLARQGDPAEIHLFLEQYARLGWIPREHQWWMREVAASVAPRRDGMAWTDVPLRSDELARLHRQHLRLLDHMFRTGFPDDRPDAWERQAAQALEED